MPASRNVVVPDLQHLDRRQLRRQPLLGRRVHGVQRAQPDEHVLLERRVVGDVAAGQRLAGDVDVRVDQPGRDDEPLAADACGVGMLRREVGRLADVDDPVAVDDDRAVADDVARGVHRHDVGTGDQRFGHTANLDVRLRCMEIRRLGSSGIEVSAFGLGTMMFGAWGNPDRDQCRRMLDMALDAGITLVDTADIYDFGVSEDMLGEFLAGRRDRVVLATKFGNAMDDDPQHRGGSRRWVREAVDRQPAPAAHRPHRPLPDAPARPRRAVRGDARRARRARRARDWSERSARRASRPNSSSSRSGSRRGAASCGPPASSRRTRSCAAGSSGRCSRCAGATTSARSCGRRSTAAG